MRRRSSGILLHVTSLPSPYGIGDLGPAAYTFADFLQAAGQNYWQMLPLNHTTAMTRYSPYNCFSAFAGNPLLISPDLLYQAGYLMKAELKDPPRFPADRVDYACVARYKGTILESAFRRFGANRKPADYELFLREHSSWLEPYAAFVALKRHFKGRRWCDWPAGWRDFGVRVSDSGLEKALAANPQSDLSDESAIINPQWIEQERFFQYVFYRQYMDLKRYCGTQGVLIAGDVPIYVAYDSADVWSHPDLFKLTAARKPRFQAGVPPDYFSKTGQLWRNPVYDWQRMEQTHFRWWMQRIKHNLLLFDLVRIDHFRGLIAYWEVPGAHETAMRGKWVQVPHGKFFAELFRQVPFPALFVEDLGYITADVREAVAKYNFPRMSVLQFAFGGDPAHNPHMPHNVAENSIIYTGTHDNNTARAWFEKDLTRPGRERLFEYFGCKVSAEEVPWELIRVAMGSVAKLAIIPMQDVLGLGAQARMNTPAKSNGNWQWRMRPGETTARLAERLRTLTAAYGRA
ncbi:MAG: 4-alpha-glucanotransferase [Planctomycetes bacterium RBG_13_62_9]|nr:MAG: 4-alpha-glucanotransferase [Planctomycetes bacterium RBG_13_62_9]